MQHRMRSWRISACVALSLVCIPSASEAHLINTRLGDFYGGVIHPLTGFEYVLPWLALAILVAFQGKQHGRWIFLIFPLGLLTGATTSLLLPGIELGPLLNLIAMAGLGLLVAFGAPLPFPLFVTLAAAIAIVHGYENALEMTQDTNRALFIGGVTAAGYAFIALATGLTFAFLDRGRDWRSIALRAGGSWIAAVGVMVLGLELTRVASAG